MPAGQREAGTLAAAMRWALEAMVEGKRCESYGITEEVREQTILMPYEDDASICLVRRVCIVNHANAACR